MNIIYSNADIIIEIMPIPLNQYYVDILINDVKLITILEMDVSNFTDELQNILYQYRI